MLDAGTELSRGGGQLALLVFTDHRRVVRGLGRAGIQHGTHTHGTAYTLHTRHLLESAHTNTHKHRALSIYLISISIYLSEHGPINKDYTTTTPLATKRSIYLSIYLSRARTHAVSLSAAPLMHELFCRRGQGRRSALREAGSGKKPY